MGSVKVEDPSAAGEGGVGEGTTSIGAPSRPGTPGMASSSLRSSGATAESSGGGSYSWFVPSDRPPFPEPGSAAGPDGRYLALGRLGRGTFCSIHKCVDLSYSHTLGNGGDGDEGAGGGSGRRRRRRHRLVAAKVELSAFANSGVLDGEATVLRHLSRSMPERMVPAFLDYVRDPNYNIPPGTGAPGSQPGQLQPQPGVMSAIIMQYLVGEDMHHLRDRHCQALAAAQAAQAAKAARAAARERGDGGRARSPPPPALIGAPGSGAGPPSSNITRRLSVKDAVYLTADVMLPLLRAMHDCGVVHRDVKPSNCVRTGTTDDDRSFKMVDFGLSKSFVVPRNSGYADAEHAWTKDWDSGGGGGGSKKAAEGSLRRERPDAEFRGTSMYASLRVHQGRDYCRRDDVWGLLYVFCDLVSGGLPWMSYALSRNRDMCRTVKEVVHGERSGRDIGLDDDGEGGGGGGKDDAGWSAAADGNENAEEGEMAEDGTPASDRVDLLLRGADHHISRHRRDEARKAGRREEDLPALAPALAMSRDPRRVGALREAFRHVSRLGFADEPDYDLVASCLQKFNGAKDGDGGEKRDEDVPPIEWNWSAEEAEAQRRRREQRVRERERGGGGRRTSKEDEDEDEDADGGKRRRGRPLFEFLDTDDADPLDEAEVDEAERDRQAASAQAQAAAEAAAAASAAAEAGAADAAPPTPSAAAEPAMSPEVSDLSRLPLNLQLRLAQAEYNACHPSTIPPHLALRDWMALALTLLRDPWHVGKYERGDHRRDEDDGYRREVYERLMRKCLDAARPFGCFCSRECFYRDSAGGGGGGGAMKRRRVVDCAEADGGSTTTASRPPRSSLLEVATAFAGLRAALELEGERKFAPPPAISFGGSESPSGGGATGGQLSLE